MAMRNLLKMAMETWPIAGRDGRGAVEYVLARGDALELLVDVPSGSVDLIFADPPYFLSNGGTTMENGERVSVDKGNWDRSMGLDGNHAWHRRWLRLCQRALHVRGSIFVSAHYQSVFSIGYAMQQLGYHVLNLISWHKSNPPPNLGCRQFTHSMEYLVWAAAAQYDPMQHTFDYEAMKQENGGTQMHDLWTFNAPHPREKALGKHSAQKPEALLTRIIRACASAGCTVLDPFVGSGTTGVAALRAGCDFIGIDTDPDYLNTARRRLAQALLPVEGRDSPTKE